MRTRTKAVEAKNEIRRSVFHTLLVNAESDLLGSDIGEAVAEAIEQYVRHRGGDSINVRTMQLGASDALAFEGRHTPFPASGYR